MIWRSSRSLARFFAIVGVGLVAAACTPDAEPAKRNACDPANRTQAVLTAASGTFHLVLPPDARDVAFATNEGGSAYELTVVFRTTPGGAQGFATTSKFPAPAAPSTRQVGQPLSAGKPLCGLGNGFAYSTVVREDSTYPGQVRSMAVDNTDATAPRVLVVAATL